VSNLTQSLNSHKQTRVLLSIKPRFAKSILSGEKQYEFRKRIFARSVDVVVIYATMPIARVVGEFDIRSVIEAPILDLWLKTQRHAGIDKQYFLEYFSGKDIGYAIEVGQVREYTNPFHPREGFGVCPPQSFAYLDGM
jgi:predicted transcriptional regulator